MNLNNIIAIIPAAGRGSRMLSLTEDCPKAMLPIQSKPIIGWHLDKLIEEGIKTVCIIVGYKKEKLIDYVNKVYSNKINVLFAEQTELLGLAHAVKNGIDLIDEKCGIQNKKLLIILGDTLIKDDLSNYLNDNSFIGYKNVEDYNRWCLIESIKADKNEIVKQFHDKPDYDPGTRKAVIGIYYFSSAELIRNNIESIIEKDIRIKNEYQLSSAMERYILSEKILTIEFNGWYDCGQIDTFNQTRKNITRHFNQIQVTDDNTIIKKSENNIKIKQEINWYLNLPNRLKVYTPQLIDYSVKPKNTFYELEYVNFSPMQELFLYELPLMEQWNKYFDVLFNVIDKFKLYSNKSNFNTKEHLENILINKTEERLESIYNNKQLKGLFVYSGIKINGKLYKNINLMWHNITQYIRNNILSSSTENWQIMHGDLFFGNMLYDIGSRTLKLIDPRGNFDIDGIYGDIRYDIAKMNHSIVGKYDFIVNDLFAIIKDNDNEFEYLLYDTCRHNKIEELWKLQLEEKGYNYNDILVITGLLFLSMIPLHAENVNHQKMFYLKAIELFNQIF